MRIMKFDSKIKALVVEVMQKSRCQQYTPETLCKIQKIIETQYFYYWSMDMKKEEYAADLFTKDFVYNCFGEQDISGEAQAMRSKYVNRNMCTMHMSHQPLIWLIDETNARGIFLYEDHHTYKGSENDTVQNCSVYCDDFRLCEDGLWRISRMRVAFRKMDGHFKETDPPEGWEPKSIDPWTPAAEMQKEQCPENK